MRTFPSQPNSLGNTSILEHHLMYTFTASNGDLMADGAVLRHFLQLAGDPQNPDLESSIAIQQSAGSDQAQRERSLIHHLRHLYVL
jgi:hypothetical protein